MCFLLKLKQPASVMFLKFHPSCYQFLHPRETLYSLVMSQRQEIHSRNFASDKWIIEKVKVIDSIMLARRCLESRVKRFQKHFTVVWATPSWSLSGEIYESTFTLFLVLCNSEVTQQLAQSCRRNHHVFKQGKWIFMGSM